MNQIQRDLTKKLSSDIVMPCAIAIMCWGMFTDNAWLVVPAGIASFILAHYAAVR